MGKVTITIEFRVLEIVLVPHQICHTKKDRITAMYFSTPSAKTCSFSDGDFLEEMTLYDSVRKYVLGTIRSWCHLLRLTFNGNTRKITASRLQS